MKYKYGKQFQLKQALTELQRWFENDNDPPCEDCAKEAYDIIKYLLKKKL